MSTTAKLISIGNSRGIRLPKGLINEYHFTDEVVLDPREDGLLIHAPRHPRAGWGRAFAKVKSGKIQRRTATTPIFENRFDKEWEW